MPERAKGPRLWPRPERRDVAGRVTHTPVWLILDGGAQRSTECGLADRGGAEQALATYISEKHVAAAAQGNRHPSRIPVADVLALYARDIAPKHARPTESAGRIKRLLGFFGRRYLGEVNGNLCRQYATERGSTSARRELEELRAAINHHRREGLCSEVIGVALPAAPEARERWLTRSEAAILIWKAWRYREVQRGVVTNRRSRRHAAKFILLSLYTGTRAGAVCAAALQPTSGRGWIDLERGVFYRRAAGAKKTKKRQPPVPLPDRLLAHLRRWKAKGQRYAVEWNGEPIKRVTKAFAASARAAKLAGVTPHTLRHTAATWLMQDGVDLWEAAGYLGMTVDMLSTNYGHHHPRHLENARRAFDRRRQNIRQRIAGEEQEQTLANVTKMAEYPRRP